MLPDDRHVVPDVERVLETNQRYWIVEKLDRAGAIATKFDPRSRTRADAPTQLRDGTRKGGRRPE